MSPTITDEPRYSTLADQLDAQLSALEGLVHQRKTDDEAKVEHTRRNMEPESREAVKIQADLEAILEKYGPILDRMTALDTQTLRTFRGYNIPGDIVGDAKKLKDRLVLGVRRLSQIPQEAANLRMKDLEEGLPQRISQDVRDLRNEPGRVMDKIKELLERLTHFEAARQR